MKQTNIPKGNSALGPFFDFFKSSLVCAVISCLSQQGGVDFQFKRPLTSLASLLPNCGKHCQSSLADPVTLWQAADHSQVLKIWASLGQGG